MMVRGSPRLLKDLPRDEWMEAADRCDDCGARQMVKVTWVDESGCFGSVTVKTEHAPDCYRITGSYPDYTPPENPLVYDDVAGWEWSDRKIKVAGKEWMALKGRANIGPCLNCMKLVVGVPLILWPPDGEVELDFCLRCAEELGILDQLKPSETGQMKIGGSV